MPVSLFVQFTRITNIFYLLNAIFQSLPDISTNSNLATIIPLTFVVVLGMLRELVADLKRFKQDRATNNRLYDVLVDRNDLSRFKEIKSRDIKVGDVLILRDD